jgi:hypothetical protein
MHPDADSMGVPIAMEPGADAALRLLPVVAIKS